jgi:hypothetical protein
MMRRYGAHERYGALESRVTRKKREVNHDDDAMEGIGPCASDYCDSPAI